MKHLITLILLLDALCSYGQKAKRVTPAYFISGQMTSPDSFNRFLLVAIPDFKPRSFDSTGKSTWQYTFASPDTTLTITYYIDNVHVIEKSKSGLTTSKERSISHIELKSDLPTLVKLYNRVFNKTATPAEIRHEMPIQGPLWYGYSDYVWNKNDYWFTFNEFKPSGPLVMMFRKTN